MCVPKEDPHGQNPACLGIDFLGGLEKIDKSIRQLLKTYTT